MTNEPTKRKCSKCGQTYELKSPWQELWRLPTLQEWLVLFMLIMIFILSWAYKHDVTQAQYYVKNIDTICIQKGFESIHPSNFSLNLTNLNNSMHGTP